MRSAAPPKLAVASGRTWLAPDSLGLDISRITGEPCSGQSTRLLPLATSPTLAEVETSAVQSLPLGIATPAQCTPSNIEGITPYSSESDRHDRIACCSVSAR